jgi:HK97 family phage portal protein
VNWRDMLPWRKKDSGTLALFQELYGGRTTSTGKAVTVKTSIEVATVFACCRVIGEGLAQVPLKLIRESEDGKTRLPAKDHPLYQLLAFQPNAKQTSFEFRETIAWHLVLCGNAYVFKSKMGNKLLELIPFEPKSVVVKQADDGTLTYEVRADNGKSQIFPAEAIWHIRGPSWNTWMGLESVALAREAIGLAMATEEASGSLHKNGVRPSGVYSVEGTLKDDQYKALSKWIGENMAGSANAGGAMILDRSAKWINTQMSGIDAQSIETRRFQIEEICRFFRVMPIMVGYSDKAATYASAEQMFLAHVVHTLAPWYQRLEQSIDANLLTPKERAAGLYASFVEEGLLRGSMAETKDTLLGYVNGGLMTPNEGRAKLDMNPDADPESDKLRIPTNIVGAVPPADPKVAENAKEIADLRLELKHSTQKSPSFNVTLNQEPVTVTMPEMRAGDVNVSVPEQKQPEITVNVAPAEVHNAAPVVNIEPAAVNVTVEPPLVQLEATLPTPTVIVSLPKRKTTGTIERDAGGNIVKTTQIESDA